MFSSKPPAIPNPKTLEVKMSPPLPPKTPTAPPSEFTGRPRSAAYAQALDQWAELERELEHTRSRLQAANGHIMVLEESNKILHEELEALKQENHKLSRENTIIHTRLSDAAHALLNITRPLTTEKPARDPNPIDVNHEIEKLIASERLDTPANQ